MDEPHLGTVRVRSSIRHRQNSGTRVLELEVLVIEFLPVDALPSRAVESSEITALTPAVQSRLSERGKRETEEELHT